MVNEKENCYKLKTLNQLNNVASGPMNYVIKQTTRQDKQKIE